MRQIRKYSELAELQTFEERFEYLRLDSKLGISTFGFDRFINQRFYTSREWRRVRNEVIVRDRSCDLGISDRELFSGVHVHHINPLTVEDIEKGSEFLLDPQFLITVSSTTHNGIHFGKAPPQPIIIQRRKGDTRLW